MASSGAHIDLLTLRKSSSQEFRSFWEGKIMEYCVGGRLEGQNRKNCEWVNRIFERKLQSV